MVSIRPAIPTDCSDLASIYNQEVRTNVCTFDTLEKSAEDMAAKLSYLQPSHAILVACEKDQVIAWGCLTPWSERQAYAPTTEMSVYVSPDFRQQGVGGQLMASLVTTAEEKGFWTILGRIAQGNRASLKICSDHGFVVVGTMRQVGEKFNKRLDVVLVQKMLHEEQS